MIGFQTIFQILIGIVVIGILILIHEAGHFLVAKLSKIKVNIFSIGFGTPLFKYKRNETEYRISMIPFGGYVQMAGENPEQTSTSRPGDFSSKPVIIRILVAAAGPFFNIVSAILFLTIVMIVGVKIPLYLENTTIGYVVENSSADKAGLEPGDVIKEINDKNVYSWQDITKILQLNQNRVNTITVMRNNTQRSFTLPKSSNEGIRENNNLTFGLIPSPPPIIGEIEDGSPAQKSGLRAGDSVVTINNDTVFSWVHLSKMIESYDTTKYPLVFTISRNNEIIESLLVQPRYNHTLQRYTIGISMPSVATKVVQYNFSEAVSLAVQRSWEIVVLTFTFIQKLITGDASTNQVAGPVGIIQLSGAVASQGISAILSFMALISINLALLNLLPLVITDGGQILFYIIEGIRGKPISPKTQQMINAVAITFFIFIFVYVTINDLFRTNELF